MQKVQDSQNESSCPVFSKDMSLILNDKKKWKQRVTPFHDNFGAI